MELKNAKCVLLLVSSRRLHRERLASSVRVCERTCTSDARENMRRACARMFVREARRAIPRRAGTRACRCTCV